MTVKIINFSIFTWSFAGFRICPGTMVWTKNESEANLYKTNEPGLQLIILNKPVAPVYFTSPVTSEILVPFSLVAILNGNGAKSSQQPHVNPGKEKPWDLTFFFNSVALGLFS